MGRMTKWDKEIVDKIIFRKPDFESNSIKKAYRDLRKEGKSQEEILDFLSGGTADTRWIYWLKSAPKTEKQLRKVV